MFEISYLAFCFILMMMMVIGAFAALFFKAKFEPKEDTKKTIFEYKTSEAKKAIFEYKTSKDYERLYQLLNDGNSVLVKTKGTLSDKNWYYNAWKTHSSRHKDEYYLGAGNSEEIESLEKFILYCKFKDIEFLDFDTSK